jgi:hypothetical protein
MKQLPLPNGRQLVLECPSSDEHWNGDCDLFVVDLTRAAARKRLARVAAVKKLKRADRDVWSVRFLGDQGGYYERDADARTTSPTLSPTTRSTRSRSSRPATRRAPSARTATAPASPWRVAASSSGRTRCTGRPS